MKFLNIFTRDDATGKFSGTTLRTWILFLVFVVFAVALGVIAAFIAIGKITEDLKPGVLLFFDSLGTFCLLGQAAYLGKRITEKLPLKINHNGDYQCSAESTKTKK